MFKWFQSNYFKSNPGRCYLLTTFKSEMDFKKSENLIESENSTLTLGVNIEGRLNFECNTKRL